MKKKLLITVHLFSWEIIPNKMVHSWDYRVRTTYSWLCITVGITNITEE